MDHAQYRPIKQHKQQPFLTALARFGKITRAAKAVRISRDAVHDWRRKDKAFASQFAIAKEKFHHFNQRGWIVFSLPAHSRPELPKSLPDLIERPAYLNEQRLRNSLLGLYAPSLT